MGGRIGDKINGLDHFALHVTNLQRSADWYSDIFGWSLLHKWNTTWMVGRGSMKVGLFLRSDATSILDPDKALIIQHVALSIDADKFDFVCKELKQGGVPFAGPDDSGIAFSIFLQDPDGHAIELTTYHSTLSVQSLASG